MKPGLQLRVSQHLALTPQLQQSIRLLQLSALDLDQEIEQVLLDNPLLERDDLDKFSIHAPSHDEPRTQTEAADEPPAAEESNNTSDLDWGNDSLFSHKQHDPDDDVDAGEIQPAAVGLREHLGAQLALTQLGGRERSIVAFLIEALDSDGYLGQTLDELAEAIGEDADIDREELLQELSIGLHHLQQFDPSGIGARTPQECLDLQLQSQPASAVRDLARQIVRDHLDHLAARDYKKIKAALDCNDKELLSAETLIKSLVPKPGMQYAPLDTRYVIPDVIVKKQNGRWQATLNREAMPRLHINRLYANILKNERRRKDSGASTLTGQLQEARQLIRNLQQRFDSIARVSQAIVDRQRAFFDYGEVAMRALKMSEVADDLGVHESTVSRIANQKYLTCSRGIFELRFFFGSRIATDVGGAASSVAIRALIKQIIDAEDNGHPLSDARIAEILGEQGILVARRTVAKYRESVNIPPARLRTHPKEAT